MYLYIDITLIIMYYNINKKQKAVDPDQGNQLPPIKKKGKPIITQSAKWYKIMRRTNSKETMEAIKNAIMESYEVAEEYYTYDGKETKTDYNDICKDILTAFENEKVKYDCQYKAGRISKYSLFCDWMAGLPTAFPISDDIFLGSAVDWLADILDETEEEKGRYTEDKAEATACNLLYRELTKHATKAK